MKKGFTLIEVIIVLGIIAVITSIAIPNFTAIRDNSKKKADIQSCEVIKRTVMMLMADDTIMLSDNSKINFNPNNEKDKISGNISGDEKNALEEALDDVKTPQLKKEDTYTISLEKKKVKVNLTYNEDIGTK